MSENLPNIDDLFRKALDAHEDNPSGNVWAEIDKSLDKKNVVFISKKYKKLKWVAAALLIFSAGMAMYTINTRLRNKELVKQNQINKKTVGATGGTSIRKDESNNTVRQPDEKTVDNATAPIAKNSEKATENTDSASTETVTRNTRKQNKGQSEDLPETVEKPEVEKQSKSSNATAAIERKDNVVVNGDKNSSAIQDEPAVETTARNIDVTIARGREKSLTIAEPKGIESGKTSGIFNEKNSQINEDNSTSKNASVKPFRTSKFSATVFYSPDFVSSRVVNDRRVFREDDRNEIKNKEKMSHSSSKGVLIHYDLGNRWSIQSGLSFSTMTTDIAPKTIFARPDNRGNIHYRFNCSAGYSYVNFNSVAGRPASGDSVLALSSQQTLKYFAVPLAFSYKLTSGKVSLQPAAGIAVNFLTSGKIETSIAAQSGNEKSSLDRIEGLNSSYVNGAISLAANYYFTKNIGLNFTPTTRFALSAINKDAPVKTYLNSFGLATGLTFRF